MAGGCKKQEDECFRRLNTRQALHKLRESNHVALAEYFRKSFKESSQLFLYLDKEIRED
jgi:hypothetical protein